MLTTRDGPAIIDPKARYWSKITIFPKLGGPRRNAVCMEKLEWYGKNCEKNEDVFIRFDRIHELDGRTDGHHMTA